MESPDPSSKAVPKWIYHPLSVVVRTFRGDSTLAKRLAGALSEWLQVGLVFHGPGALEKSGFTAVSSGSWAVLGVDGRHSALWREGHFDLATLRLQLLEADVAVVEGSPGDGSLLVVETDPLGGGLDVLESGELASLVACVGVRPERVPPGGLPCFSEDDLDALVEHLRECLDTRLQERSLWGLLETDLGPEHPQAARLGQTLRENTRGLLVRGAQAARWERSGAIALDAGGFTSLGRAGQVLSQWEFDPQGAFLRVECSEDTAIRLEPLVAARDPFRFATAFRETQSHLPLPQAVIWEPKSRSRILQAVASGVTCPERILVHARTALVDRAD